MGFALSKLTAMARGGRRTRDIEDLPVLRRADAHPDAPARHPIFASRDFGAPDIFARPLTAAPPPVEEAPEIVDELLDEGEEAPAVVSAEGLTLPHAPEPLSDQEITAALAARLREPMLQAGRAPVAEALEKLSIAELAERFERGLARRTALAQAAQASDRAESAIDTPPPFAPAAPSWALSNPMPVLAEIPPARPVPLRPDVDADIDQALRAALGTLRKMTSRAG